MGTPLSSSALRAASDSGDATRDAVRAAGRVPRRRRWWLLVTALVLAAGGGLSSAWLLSAADERVQVLVAARSIAWGQEVTEADLRAVPVPPETAASLLPASRRAAVVGQSAAVSVPQGAILAPGHLTRDGVPAEGQVLIGLRAEPGSLPARGLRPGERVSVRPVGETSTSEPPPSTSDGGGGAHGSGRFEARVVEVGPPNTQGEATVDVVVDAEHVEAASDASAGRVVLMLLGPGR